MHEHVAVREEAQLLVVLEEVRVRPEGSGADTDERDPALLALDFSLELEACEARPSGRFISLLRCAGARPKVSTCLPGRLA